MAAKKPRLGRGLEALLSETSPLLLERTSNAESYPPHIEGQLKDLPLDMLQKGKYQPRREFSEESLNELADSIRAQGVIQPIIVRSLPSGYYEIIAGERRWRAAQLAGLASIPALVRELPDEAAIALALIENIQREDLSPMEEAFALQRLIKEFSLTHQEVANAVGKSRTNVTNLLRLLDLQSAVADMLLQNKIEMGHARALLALDPKKQLAAAQTIVEKKLSVRETEQLVRRLQAVIQNNQPAKNLDHTLETLQNQLTEKLHTTITIQQSSKGKGKLIISYKDLAELQKIAAKLREGYE